MKTIIVNQGKANLAEVPTPKLEPNQKKRVLIKVRYSAISPGTELGLINNIQTPDGFQLGYSASGEVIQVGEQVDNLKKGDLVACYGGPYVYHAEYLSVPAQLCVKVPSEDLFRAAAYVGLGAVGIHSVRRFQLQFGETVWVIGLGMLGMLIAQLCVVNNYRVFATDMNTERCNMARGLGIDSVFMPNDVDLQKQVQMFTDGYGFDCIALCAHTSNPKMIESSMENLSLRGKMAIVGNVPIEFSRELFFQKEAELVIARAAGPGRYDPQYEDQGIDYPRPFVKWTEGRNMKEFIRLVSTRKLDIESYITHEFPVQDAENAYRLLQQQNSATLGVLFRYN